MKRQAESDLWYVIRYLRTKNDQCSLLHGVKEVRIEAVKTRAQERGKTEQTIYRHLKLAAGLDKHGTADDLDLYLFDQIRRQQ